MRMASLWLVCVLLLAGCATGRAPRVESPTLAPTPKSSAMSGQASWYGRPHHGRRTSSGEAYDMNKLTAAHRTLPLGTRVLVTNLDNGRTVEVRINDRGPFRRNRVLDLSYAAAQQLGAIGEGVIPVTLEIVTSPASD
jgi:rare lipoprotein A